MKQLSVFKQKQAHIEDRSINLKPKSEVVKDWGVQVQAYGLVCYYKICLPGLPLSTGRLCVGRVSIA